MKEASYLSHYFKRERRRAAKELRKKRADHQYTYKDSPFTGSNFIGGWVYSFDTSFRDTIPPRFSNIKEYIEQQLAPKAYRKALEIGGEGSGAFAEFPEGFFSKTVGVNLKDERADSTKEHDSTRNHTVIEGNILARDVQRKVKKEHQGDGYDLILMRMLGGLDCLPADPFFMSTHADFAYQQLASNGVMLIELPDAFVANSPYEKRNLQRNLMPQWASLITSRYKGQIEIQLDENNSHLRLVKLDGAPEHLPFLSARTVLEQEKSSLHLREAALRRKLKAQGVKPREVTATVRQKKKEFAL
jgi:hypothetical protein